MKIAIDGSHLDPNNMSGTQFYLVELLKRLALIDNGNTYILYTKYDLEKSFIRNIFSSNPNFSFKRLEKSWSWTQVSLAHELKKQTFDLLLCPWQTMPIIRPKHLKTLAIIHGLEYGPFGFGPTLFTSTFSNHIIAVSQDTKRALLSKFLVSPSKVSIVYEGVHSEGFGASLEEVNRVKHKFGIKKRYIFFVGYMVPRKNVSRMLAAFDAMLNDVDFDVEFILAGKIPPKSRLLKFANTLHSRENIRFLGYVSKPDLVALLAGAEVLSYVSESEGFGLPVLEAMASGTAVLTSNRGALPEVAGKAAYFVDPYDLSAISKAYCNILTNPELRTNLVKSGKSQCKKFSWDKTAENVLKIINSI